MSNARNKRQAKLSHPVANPVNGRYEIFAFVNGEEFESCWFEDWREMVARLRDEDNLEVVGCDGRPLYGTDEEKI